MYQGQGCCKVHLTLNRVAMLSSVNGTSTLTAYIGSIEEVQTTGSTTTTTTYYSVQGKRIAANVNGTFSYFGYDALGSQVVVLNSSGILVGSQLYGPYGSSRYSNGTLPTSIGFTGQQADTITGLDYYVARYYDPAVGQFLSADTVQGNLLGMNPYAYVSGNPETFIDPTGHNEFGAGGDEEVAGYGEYVPYVDDGEEAEQFSTRIEETGSKLTETSGGDFAASTDTNAFTEEQSWNGELHENRWREEQQTDRNGEDNSSADNHTPAENHPTDNNANTGRWNRPLFRGTSPGYPGGANAQRLGVTSTSTDPVVATTFAVNAETQYGAGVLHIALPGDLEGVKISEGNVLANLEQEVGVWILPQEFADRASITIDASTARDILADMGIDISGRVSLSNLSDTLRNLPRLSVEQIEAFIRAIIG
ncbi:MAG TPA: RHS repeat-associated core domain-containing protein [Ktedonobacteraceae bacterium]|nr:RHS repeat-associated core domain-containing protein [Ktedonobacteraceae bacterium]